MDTTFYEEPYTGRRDLSNLKRNMRLDLDSPKRAKTSVTAAPVLSSPDLNLLKLPSPELEQFILNSNKLITPTPTQINFLKTEDSEIYHADGVTEAQEKYAQGFVEALNNLHNSGDSSQGHSERTGNEDSSGAENAPPVYTRLNDVYPPPVSGDGLYRDSPDPRRVKDEPQTVPDIVCHPGLVPPDMKDQEKMKLERKRMRNRVAASKCRRRKLERIARLEDKVKELKAENSELTGVVNKLKEQVYTLKEQVMDHVNSGCQLVHIMQS